MRRRLTVLFLCTGNSCRSQMAEGWARHLKADALEARSAGIEVHRLNPRAVAVMAEAGVDISGQQSKRVNRFAGVAFDYVVTLCAHAHEHCPVFPGSTKIVHVDFEDPSLARGTEEQVLAVFRGIRDRIRAFVESLPEALEADSQ